MMRLSALAALLLALLCRGLGAEDKPADFWSFRPVSRPETPTVNNRAWCKSPIDAFILARLEAAGLEPAPPAAKTSLLRRLYYDLDRPAADARGGRRLPGRRLARRLREEWSIACSPRRTTASAGRGTGSTSCATPRPTATSATRPSRTPGGTATTSSAASTTTSRTTSFVREQLAGDELRASHRRGHHRHRLLPAGSVGRRARPIGCRRSTTSSTTSSRPPARCSSA